LQLFALQQSLTFLPVVATWYRLTQQRCCFVVSLLYQRTSMAEVRLAGQAGAGAAAAAVARAAAAAAPGAAAGVSTPAVCIQLKLLVVEYGAAPGMFAGPLYVPWLQQQPAACNAGFLCSTGALNIIILQQQVYELCLLLALLDAAVSCMVMHTVQACSIRRHIGLLQQHHACGRWWCIACCHPRCSRLDQHQAAQRAAPLGTRGARLAWCFVACTSRQQRLCCAVAVHTPGLYSNLGESLCVVSGAMR
jgi:hypothetical protein